MTTSSRKTEDLFARLEKNMRKYVESIGYKVPAVVDSIGTVEKMILFKAKVVPILDQIEEEADQYREELERYGVDLDMLTEGEKTKVKRFLTAMAELVA